jgi:hypothetical protein
MTSRIATTYSADCERLLRALGIEGRNISRVTLDLLPQSVVVVTVERHVTADELAAVAETLQTFPLKPIGP